MRLFQNLALVLSLVLSGCAQKPATPVDASVGTSQSGLTASSAFAWADVQVAYDRAQRLRDMLGTDAPPSLTQAQMGLGNLLSGLTAATGPAIESAIGAMLTAQSQAYTVAVDRGIASPGVSDPGAWNATWWDISSP
jgi:hypothetical protein